MRIGALSLAVCALVWAADARAQVAVGGAAGASRQTEGVNDIPYLGPPFGGTSAGFLGLIDFPMGRRMTIGGEASLASALSGEQSQRSSPNTNAFTSRHRDSVFSAVLKFGTARDRLIHAAAAAGAGGAYRRTSREGTTASIFPPSVRTPYSATVSNFVLAYSLGGDVDVRITPRIRALALVRWHRLQDDDLSTDGVVKRGISSKILRVAVGAKYEF
jgi:hypothetical protein